MCLILLAYQVHPNYPLIIAANRDEFHARLTATAHFWQDAPEVLAGRDLQKSGTWLGITRQGKFAAVTNYREPHYQTCERSRGALVSDFLRGSAPISLYLQQCVNQATEYDGFNLLAGEAGQLYYYSNRGHQLQIISPGIYGLSNHLLDTPWYKVEKGKLDLAKLLNGKELSAEDLFALLNNHDKAPDARLPHTGVGLERERFLSSLFILSADYGTRCSTAIILDNQGVMEFTERSFAPTGEPVNTVKFTLRESAFRSYANVAG